MSQVYESIRQAHVVHYRAIADQIMAEAIAKHYNMRLPCSRASPSTFLAKKIVLIPRGDRNWFGKIVFVIHRRPALASESIRKKEACLLAYEKHPPAPCLNLCELHAVITLLHPISTAVGYFRHISDHITCDTELHESAFTIEI